MTDMMMMMTKMVMMTNVIIIIKCDDLLGDLRGDLVLSPGLAIRPGVCQRVLVSASRHSNVKHPKTIFDRRVFRQYSNY